MNSSRRIIYVDASFNPETNQSKISLYDKEINKLDTLVLTKADSSLEAEKCAILNALLYVKRKNIIDRKIHILNDNFNATQNEKIVTILKSYNIGLSWIPREINEIADKGTKLEVNIGEENSYLLEFFYDILMKDNKYEIKVSSVDKNENNTLTKRQNILLNAVRNSKMDNKPYVAIGQVGKYLKENNPTFQYVSLKKELLNYEKSFLIVNNDFVKIK